MTPDNLFKTVRWYFVYRPDQEQFGRADDWRSQADAVGGPWYGDCDDFAMTAADLAVRHGTDPAKVRVALCLTEVGQRRPAGLGPPYDHMVCLVDGGVNDALGAVALDCRQRRVEPWDRLAYKWHSSMRLSERGTWRALHSGAPLERIEIARPAAPVAPASLT